MNIDPFLKIRTHWFISFQYSGTSSNSKKVCFIENDRDFFHHFRDMPNDNTQRSSRFIEY